MKDLFNDMLESTELIERVETNFGRTLTAEERSILIKNGEQELLNKLGLSVEDYFTMQRAFALISAGFTESSEKYDEELEKENYKVLDLFKSLVNDLECVAAARRKVMVGKEEELGTKSKIEIPKEEDHGYKEKEDKELNKIFATRTQCQEMGISGDTYEEDDDSWKEDCGIKAEENTCPEKQCKAALSQDTQVDKIITLLDKGVELELDGELLNTVVEKLWNTRNNVSIKIHNNKISLR